MNKTSNLLYIYIIITWLICINFIDLSSFLSSIVTFKVRGIWCILSLLFIFPYIKILKKRSLNFKYEVLIFTFLPLVSGISAYVHYNQTVLQSVNVWFTCLIWMVYFGLNICNIPFRKLERFMLVMSLIILVLQIGGQILGHKIGSSNPEELEIRNNLLRLRYDTTMAMFCLFYYWVRYILFFNIKDLFFSTLMAVSIYLSLTRLRIFAALFPLVLSFLMLPHKKSKQKIIIIFLLLGILLYYFKDGIFSFFIEQTTSQVADDMNIRDYSIIYFWIDATNDFLKILIGNGIPHQDSLLGVHLMKINSLGYFADDVGIVGQWWYFGLIYILAWFSVIYKIIWKYRKNTSLYIKLYFIGTTIVSFYFFPLAHEKGWLIWSVLLYIADKDIKKNKLIKKCGINQ